MIFNKLMSSEQEGGTNHFYKRDHASTCLDYTFGGINFIFCVKRWATFTEIPDIGEVHTEYDESQFESPITSFKCDRIPDILSESHVRLGYTFAEK